MDSSTSSSTTELRDTKECVSSPLASKDESSNEDDLEETEESFSTEFSSESEFKTAEQYVYSRDELLALRYTKSSISKVKLFGLMDCYYPDGAITEVAKNKIKTSACREIAREILSNPTLYESIQCHATPYLRALIEAHKELRRREIIEELVKNNTSE